MGAQRQKGNRVTLCPRDIFICGILTMVVTITFEYLLYTHHITGTTCKITLSALLKVKIIIYIFFIYNTAVHILIHAMEFKITETVVKVSNHPKLYKDTGVYIQNTYIYIKSCSISNTELIYALF